MESQFQKEIDAFLAKGGKITTLPMHVSYDVMIAQGVGTDEIVFGLDKHKSMNQRFPAAKRQNETDIPKMDMLPTLQRDITSIYETPEYNPEPDEEYQERS